MNYLKRQASRQATDGRCIAQRAKERAIGIDPKYLSAYARRRAKSAREWMLASQEYDRAERARATKAASIKTIFGDANP